MRRSRRAVVVFVAILLAAGGCLVVLQLHAEPPPRTAENDSGERLLDPAAWGSDHVGHSPPEYLTGGECLFCHRDVGPAWPENPHQLTIRPAVPDDLAMQALTGHESAWDFASAVEYLLGGDQHVRFLQRSDEYGKLRMLSAAYRADGDREELIDAAGAEWDDDVFAARCAGCHTTAVDPETSTFSALSLDCYTCHGDVQLAHTKDTSLVHLSAVNAEPRVVVSICGQCHLRGGNSRSTGLPYPNNFIAGDNLFRDFQVNWDEAQIEGMAAGERHVFENARDVALHGLEDITCLSCHDVHDRSTEKHQDLSRTVLCATCHVPGQPAPDLGSAPVHSEVCGY